MCVLVFVYIYIYIYLFSFFLYCYAVFFFYLLLHDSFFFRVMECLLPPLICEHGKAFCGSQTCNSRRRIEPHGRLVAPFCSGSFKFIVFSVSVFSGGLCLFTYIPPEYLLWLVMLLGTKETSVNKTAKVIIFMEFIF